MMGGASPGASVRGIWLCADDYGMAPGVSAAIRELIGRERLNATSVMTTAPGFSQGEADALRDVAAGRAAIGLHVTLTAPFRPEAEGFAPIRDGHFLSVGPSLAAAFLRRFSPPALFAEVSRQFDLFRAAFGTPPAFADGHQHVQLFPQVREAVLAAMRQHAPDAWVRQCGGAAPLSERWRQPKGLLLDALSRAFRRRAAAAGVPFNPAFAGAYAFGPDADFAALFPSFLRELPAGSVVMCHPGHVDAVLARIDPLTTLREREFAFLASGALPRALEAAGLALLRPAAASTRAAAT